MGFDASLTFTVTTSGNYSLKGSAVGTLTGSYTLDAAVVGGAAMLSANSYTVSSASTLVLEGAGGVGQDVVKASVSYALAAGSEIEVLRTGNDKGKTAIDLTGNEISQSLIGNAGANVLEGKAGADILTGGGGKDTFVLSDDAVANPGAGHIDSITDYASGEVVDITQILNVAAGTNVLGGGYLRVTTSGLIQVDLSGGGNDWVTLSSVNGSSAVTIKYLSGGSATTLSVARVAAAQFSTAAAADGSHVIEAQPHWQIDHLGELAGLYAHPFTADALFT
jgi:Ca2+-binding RTX toxin-like protein